MPADKRLRQLTFFFLLNIFDPYCPMVSKYMMHFAQPNMERQTFKKTK